MRITGLIRPGKVDRKKMTLNRLAYRFLFLSGKFSGVLFARGELLFAAVLGTFFRAAGVPEAKSTFQRRFVLSSYLITGLLSDKFCVLLKKNVDMPP